MSTAAGGGTAGVRDQAIEPARRAQLAHEAALDEAVAGLDRRRVGKRHHHRQLGRQPQIDRQRRLGRAEVEHDVVGLEHLDGGQHRLGALLGLHRAEDRRLAPDQTDAGDRRVDQELAEVLRPPAQQLAVAAHRTRRAQQLMQRAAGRIGVDRRPPSCRPAPDRSRRSRRSATARFRRAPPRRRSGGSAPSLGRRRRAAASRSARRAPRSRRRGQSLCRRLPLMTRGARLPFTTPWAGTRDPSHGSCHSFRGADRRCSSQLPGGDGCRLPDLCLVVLAFVSPFHAGGVGQGAHRIVPRARRHDRPRARQPRGGGRPAPARQLARRLPGAALDSGEHGARQRRPALRRPRPDAVVGASGAPPARARRSTPASSSTSG